MKSIVISLKSATVRREHIQREFGEQNINFEFFDALTPDIASTLAKKMSLKFDDTHLTEVELACFMSHVYLWNKIVEEDIAYMAIFEDDVYLGENADCYLNDNNWIQADCHVIKLEAFSNKILHESTGTNIGNGRKLFKLKSRHLGAAGYILSLSAAQYFLEFIQNNKIDEPLDHILFDKKFHPENFPLFQIKPALCIQSYLYKQDKKGNFFSDLEAQRVNRRMTESRARKINDKLFREIQRLKKQVCNFLFKKRINFR